MTTHAEWLAYLRRFRRFNGRSPSHRELANNFRIMSKNGVRAHLQRMARDGVIELDNGEIRIKETTHAR